MRAQPGQPSGQLEGCATLLAADAPGRRRRLSYSMKLQPALHHVTIVSPRTPAAG